MERRFADIPNFPDYQVSDDGKVWSYKTGSGAKGNTGRRELTASIAPPRRPHALVSMMGGNGEPTTRYIHHLVMEAFCTPQQEGQTQRDHIDRNPVNNHYTNLRWVTPHENLMNRSSHDTPDLYIREFKYKTRTSFGVQIPNHIANNDGKGLSLGSYKTIEEARRVRDAYLRDGTMPQRELPKGITKTTCRGVEYYRLTIARKYIGQWTTLEEAVAVMEQHP